jgi:hypothetical protein
MTRLFTLLFRNAPNAKLANSLPKIEMDFQTGEAIFPATLLGKFIR